MAERLSATPSQPTHARDAFPSSNPDIFSDDFALEPFELTSGHQQASVETDGSHDAMSAVPRRSVSFQRNQESPTGSMRRSRMSQRSDGGISALSRVDDRASQSSHPRSVTSVSDSGNSASTQHRSIRTISTFGFPRAQSPYQGATGPSQPYGMYPQDIGLVRTPSAVTASTIRQPERSYSGPSGPTQPYGMYAQNTPEDDAGIVAGLAPPIAAGFPGSQQNFERRLGPEGADVDDLIGPDGYTEQLPPYSRYANGVPPKYTSGIGSIHRRAAPPPPISSGEASQETPIRPQPGDNDLVNPFADSSTQVSSVTSDVNLPKDEGGSFKERVQRKGKKKVCCGISCWLCLTLVVIVFFAVLLGGIVGGVVAHKRGEEKGKQEALAGQTGTAVAAAPTATVTQTSPPPDAVSLSSSPTNLPALPTGTYSITLNDPTTATNSCLTFPGQAPAWDCATGAQLSIDVSMAGPNAPVVALSYPQGPNTPIRYGAQPPQLNGDANLMLFKDREESNQGPAYFFWQQYNKTVIVHDSDLPGGQPESKRSFLRRWFFDEEDPEDANNLFERDPNDIDSQWPSNTIAKAGEKPWYCSWPDTILEGFIYVYQNASGNPSASATLSSAAATNAVAFVPPRDKRQAPMDLQPYPKMVKIEERRNPHSPVQPYCQQMQILYNGRVNPVTDPTTQIQLTENEPLVQHQMNQNQEADGGPSTNAAFPTSFPGRRRGMEKRAFAGNGPLCQCEWMGT